MRSSAPRVRPSAPTASTSSGWSRLLLPPRIAGGCGLVSLVAMLAGIAVAYNAYPGYSWLERYISELANPINPRRFAFTLALVGAGPFVVLFSLGLPGLLTNRVGLVASRLLTATGLAMPAVGTFDLGQPVPHFGAAAVLCGSAVLATLFAGMSLARLARGGAGSENGTGTADVVEPQNGTAAENGTGTADVVEAQNGTAAGIGTGTADVVEAQNGAEAKSGHRTGTGPEAANEPGTGTGPRAMSPAAARAASRLSYALFGVQIASTIAGFAYTGVLVARMEVVSAEQLLTELPRHQRLALEGGGTLNPVALGEWVFLGTAVLLIGLLSISLLRGIPKDAG